MDPITHALSSLLLARALQTKLPRFGLVMLLVAGVAPDLDSLSYFFGAAAYLRFHQSLLHSLVSSLLLAAVIGAAFVALDRKQLDKRLETDRAPLKLTSAFAVCAAGITLHLVLDAASIIGFQPLWPFRIHWTALNYVPHFEIWIVLILVAGLVIPELINMVSEEIGDYRKAPRGILTAAIGFCLLFAYIGARAALHSHAVALLGSREYESAAPIAVGAFPTASPFTWRGIVATEQSMIEVDVPFLSGETFDPDRGVVHNKPDDSPALTVATAAPPTKAFLAFAKFPLASVDASDNDHGSRVIFRDLRFPANDKSPDNLAVEILVSPTQQAVDETTYFNAVGTNH